MKKTGQAMAVACVLFVATSCSKAPAWEALPLGTSADFRAIWFTDADHGWIAGGGFQIVGGLIGRTEDAGKSWRFTSNLTPREGMSVEAIHVFKTGRAIVSTNSGAILETKDSGEIWTPVARVGRVDSLSSFFFLDERRGWAAGHGDLLRTDDAGDTWTPLTPKGVDTAYQSPIRAIQFSDDQHGWAAGMQASLLRTVNGGVTWDPASMPLAAGEHPSFWDMCLVDRQTGWVVGEEGTILATTDGGDTWMRQETGLKDARSAEKLEHIQRPGGAVVVDAGGRSPGFTITAVQFVDSNRGWITGFYAGLGHSLILRTEDAGATWVVDADIPGEDLHALFVGRDRLWAIGARVRPGPQSIYRRSLAR